MKLPTFPFYQLIRLGGRLFGKFDIEQTSPLECVKRSTIPTIFIHGDNDTLVPVEMSKALYEAKIGKKALVIIEGAEHGLAYPQNNEKYISAILDFEKEWR